jgi:hypothetical protein
MSDEYKLMGICEGELDFELLIFGSIDECKDYKISLFHFISPSSISPILFSSFFLYQSA